MVSAVICEYNPFHNGHKYQLDCMKRENDAVICIMSGDFVQRGDAAVFDKFIRARAALLSGADLVIMLPVCFSLSSAELFAAGGVRLCADLGIVDRLYFGSECGDIRALTAAARLLSDEPPEVSARLKAHLKNGISYPSAKAAAFEGLIDKEILTEPNNILAVEYIKALIRLDSKIQPVTIKRHMAEHHDNAPSGDIASASFVRTSIKKGCSCSDYVPDSAFELYKGLSAAKLSELDSALLYAIRTKTPENIAAVNDVGEGLENRIKAALSVCGGFEGISEYIKTKRYTLTRIKRILLSLLLDIDKETPKAAPGYIRVLGMNGRGAELLSSIKRLSSLPIITKAADFKGFNKSFEYDILAGDLYTICSGMPCFGKDYLTSPVIIKSILSTT